MVIIIALMCCVPLGIVIVNEKRMRKMDDEEKRLIQQIRAVRFYNDLDK